MIGHLSDKAAGQFQGGRPLPCYLRPGRSKGVGGGSGGGVGEIPATCENSQTQTITEGQPGYQEAEVELEQDQVRGDLYFEKGFHGT